jgi:hypothetical protein
LKQCSVGVQCINSACVVRYGFTTAFAGNSSNGTTYILAMKIDVPKAVTVTHLAALARGTGFSVVMGLYTDVGGNPGTLVVQTAATSVNATGNLAMAVTATNIGAGTYWLGAQTNSTGVFGYDSAAVPGYAYNNVGPYSGVLPVSWTAAGTYGVVSTGTENFWIVARE